MDAMRTILNIIWIIFAGFWLFVGYVAAGVVLCIPIITIPWAIASFRTAGYVIWPFGRTIVAKPTAGVGSFLGNVDSRRRVDGAYPQCRRSQSVGGRRIRLTSVRRCLSFSRSS